MYYVNFYIKLFLNMENMDLKVQDIKKLKWNSLSLEEKLEIKRKGRPTPDFVVTQEGLSRGKCYTRKIVGNLLYKEHDWVCGCTETKAFFCFPCLLYGGTDMWSKKGATNAQKISVYISDHASNKKHMENVFKFNILGQSNVAAQLNSAYHAKIIADNKQILKNRELLSRIIDCIRFCGAFELALRGHRETEGSNNPGVFLGLINFTAALDADMKTHLEKSTVFKGTSSTIQNELLQCMLAVVREEIVHQIKEAEYVALISDETTDLSMSLQLVTIFRYLDNAGNVYERFWGFCNPKNHKAESITTELISDLHTVLGEKRSKLISQGYDGASVMSGIMNGVQAKIREIYCNAHYIHCLCHQTNLIMQRACSANQRACAFFASLNTIPVFFSNSSDRCDALDICAKKRIPRATPIRWNYKSRTVNCVYENLEALHECFSKLQSNCYSSATISGACNLQRTLEDSEFCIWLTFFHKIMPHVDILYSCLQGRDVDASLAATHINNFLLTIENIRDDISEGRLLLEEDENSPARKRRRTIHGPSQSLKAAAIEVCDLILANTRERFGFTDHLEASALFFTSKFGEYHRVFPETALKTTVAIFPMLQEKELRTELEVLYTRLELRTCSGAVPLLKFLMQHNMQSTFTQVTKLLRIVCTMPMSTAEAERSFSTLARVKTFLRNTMGEERLSALAMLSIEKELISQITDFNSKVIDKFASQTTRRMDFVLRKT